MVINGTAHWLKLLQKVTFERSLMVWRHEELHYSQYSCLLTQIAMWYHKLSGSIPPERMQVKFKASLITQLTLLAKYKTNQS